MPSWLIFTLPNPLLTDLFMKLLRFSFLLLSFPLFFLASCSKDDGPAPVDTDDAAYFPLRKGHFVEYHVDSTYWDDFTGIETPRSLDLRYVVSDTLTDNEGRLSYTITVSRRKDATELWQPESIFIVTRTSERLEWIQNNLRFVKLVFPVQAKREWNGNEFISTLDPGKLFYGGWKYTYADVGATAKNDFKTFENTLTVNQVDETINNPEQQPNSYASRTYGQEKYAKNVGLIEKRFIHWTYDPGVAPYRKGVSVVMRAFNHNN